MALTSGRRLGPYQVLAPLGAGGMGEVYRARDTRLGRDVAIKVVPAHLSASPEIRTRFEHEARTISQLTHPHICTLYDVGHQDDVDYLVMELLEGETLAHRLEKGPLPLAEVLRIGTQIAEALDRAHQSGIVHRDLKPGNVMLTKDGAKLMDFGLARATGLMAWAGAETESPTVSRPLTAEGTVVGTFQYMAPEQLEGKEADARADIWALGCVLYEMATGRRAFEGTSQASLIAAILEHEPAAITALRPTSPPVLEHVVRGCLAKDPAERWQSARDVVRELAWVAGTSEAASGFAGAVAPARARVRVRAVVCLAAAAILLAAGSFLVGHRTARPPVSPTFARLTFQRGYIHTARFAPDGKSVLYSAGWEGNAPEIFETRTDRSATRPLGLQGMHLHAVSRTGQLALKRRYKWFGFGWGPLAVAPLSGSAPRDLSEDVSEADWAPDGTTLAIVRRVGGEDRLEMPPGRVLTTTPGTFGNLRVSPDGQRVGLTEHTVIGDARGRVAVLDAAGRKTTLTDEFSNVAGLAWSPNGREIWFSADTEGMEQSLQAAALDGRLRRVAQFPTRVVLHDVAPDGHVLLSSERVQTGIRGRSSPDDKERELGWSDFSFCRAISSDGRMLLFDDEGEGGGPSYTTYVRKMDGSPPVRLGEGAACALSPDRRWALAIHFGPPHRLLLMPTGTGETVVLPRGSVETYQAASFLPDGRRIVFAGAERERPQRTWIQDFPSGVPHPVTPEGATGVTTSPDGRWVAAVTQDRTLMLFPLQGGEPRFLAKIGQEEAVSEWSADGRTLFVFRQAARLDAFGVSVESGERRLWRSFEVPDPAGAVGAAFVVTRDARAYVYGYLRFLDELYLVEGLR
jgi:Tol biopolymer transport system component